MARYIVGIDLGTTNCAVSYLDTETLGDNLSPDDIAMLDIAQVRAPGEVEHQNTLPSFLLLPGEHEIKPEAMVLPWSVLPPHYCVGVLARERGAELPHRLVSSAKSWLSHGGVDRTAAILPWQGAQSDRAKTDTPRVSPVEASSRYLAHLSSAWEASLGAGDPLAEQDVFLAVPASFDAVARELTVVAARQAGLDNLTLIEEPQAAFYAWLAQAGDSWRNQLSPGDVVLVCDVGGGTTDFSLIAVTDEGSGNLELERIAVGEHILLGGDNMDLALAYAMSQKLANQKLSSAQFRSLVYSCRRAKEKLLSQDAPAAVPIAILGTSSKLIGGALTAQITKEDANAILLDGFVPKVERQTKVRERRALGLRELGLPYAADPAISRHLASFLARHQRMPTAILWNGGIMKSLALQERIADNLNDWVGDKKLVELSGANLDLSVARGAAYYGAVRRGRGIRIRGGTARSYYIGVESAVMAVPGMVPPIKGLCVAPFGMEEGSAEDLPEEELGITVGEPTTFRFFASAARKNDGVGALIDIDEGGFLELSPVEMTLPADGHIRAGDIIPVRLSAKVTEVGTLELWCEARAGDGRWKLEYSVRDELGPKETP